MKNDFEWTDERTQELRELRHEHGLSSAQIGRHFGISRNAVLGKLHRMKVPCPQSIKEVVSRPKFWTAARVTLLTELFEAGETYSKIGDQLGVSEDAIYQKLKSLGMSRKHASGAKEDLEEKSKHSGVFVNTYTHDLIPVERAGAADMAQFVATGKGVTLLSLSSAHCRWPLGEGRAVLFCGEPRAGGSPYCTCHYKRAYTITPGIVQARKAIAAATGK